MTKTQEAALVSKDVHPLEPTTWAAMKDQATMLVKSGFLPTAVNTAEKALAIALAGRELGIGVMESMRSINVIQGKPTISPQLMLALANRTGQLENLDIAATDEKCVVKVKRKGRTVYSNEFGVKEATDLGLMTKDNYRKQKKTMFQWRALAANLRVTFPDVVLGLYTPEELDAEVRIGENGAMEVVDVKPTEQAPLTPPENLQKSEKTVIIPKDVEKNVHGEQVYWVINDIADEKYFTNIQAVADIAMLTVKEKGKLEVTYKMVKRLNNERVPMIEEARVLHEARR